MLKFIKPALVVALCISLSACFGRLQPLYSVNNSPISMANSKLPYAKIQKAIIAAGSSRNWIMQKRKGHVIRATQTRRSHVAIVDISYTRTDFSISYVQSHNLEHSGNSIHRTYNHWVHNLESDIRKNLSLLAN